MRWAWLVVALGAGGIAIAAPSAGTKVASTSTAPQPKAETTSEPAVVDPPIEEPVPPEYADGKKAPKLSDIIVDVTPNAYTNDPVLGLGERLVGDDVPNLIAFTFDDGPRPETTPLVLAALKKYDIPASFFIVTRHFRRGNPRTHAVLSRTLLAQELAAGHLVGSHGTMHDRLLEAKPADIDREVDASLKELSTYANRTIGMFRPPFGKINYAGRKRLKSLGVTEVFWSIDPRDWEAEEDGGRELRHKIARAIHSAGGGVIVLHDSKPVTASIIAGVFDDLEAANCRRLANRETPIYPVSLHYFLRDGGLPRAIPDDVAKRTAAYKAALPARCAKRKPQH